VDLGKIESGVELILRGLECDLSDPNFLDTPSRVARFYAEMFATKDNGWATFPEAYTEFILLRGHRMWSLCPHHLLPVRFDVSLAYIPGGDVLGLSKLARLLDEANTGPLLQEKFTKDVIDAINTICRGVQGCAVLVEGQHGCTLIRGVKSNAEFVTYRLDGIFKTSPELEDRFFMLAGAGGRKSV
jgi:GTP cyclohydrolase I